MHVNTSIGVVVVAVDDVNVPVLTPDVRFLEFSIGDVLDVFGNEVGRRKLSLVSMSHIRTEKSPRSVRLIYFFVFVTAISFLYRLLWPLHFQPMKCIRCDR